MRRMPGDDPTELFDLVDPDGHPLGVSKPRGLVHRDGDWHRSVHIWVVLEDGAILFQRRSLTKDTHPGKVDVSVAGHLRAGEALVDALREADEEIGLVVRLEDVVRLGVRRRVDARPPSHVDREVQDVFLVRTGRPLESLRPDPDEVLGLLAVPLNEAVSLVNHDVEAALGRELRAGSPAVRDVTLGMGELLPDPDGYFALALASIAKVVRGELAEEWTLG